MKGKVCGKTIKTKHTLKPNKLPIKLWRGTCELVAKAITEDIAKEWDNLGLPGQVHDGILTTPGGATGIFCSLNPHFEMKATLYEIILKRLLNGVEV